jgi:hypothetical protein
MNTAYCRVQRVPYCCGAYEVGSMVVGSYNESYAQPGTGIVAAHGATKEEAANNLLNKLLDYGQFSLQFWFKRPIVEANHRTTINNVKEKQYQKEFVAQELLDAVIEAGGLEMARYLNPNTKNELYGIILTTNCVSLKE